MVEQLEHRVLLSGTSANPIASAYPIEQAGDAAFRSNSGFTSFELDRGDDYNSSPLVSTGFGVNFFGDTYQGVYVNNNGNITFKSSLPDYSPGELELAETVIIAPFFADVDTWNPDSGVVTYGTSTVDGRPAFGVNWKNVGYFREKADKLNDFQLVLIDRSDIAVGDFDFEFNYSKIQWETGDNDGGLNGLGGNSALAGYSNGEVVSYTFRGSEVNGAFLDSGPGSTSLIKNKVNSVVDGRYRFSVRGGIVQPEIDVVDSFVGVPDNTGQVDFGPILSGESSTRNITIHNFGNRSLIVQPATITGPFTISANLNTNQVIAPNTSASITVRFNGGVVGDYSGTLSFVNNDTDESPFNFSLIGRVTGVPDPEIQVLLGSNDIQDGVGAISFGRTVSAVSRTFTVWNRGTSNLIVQPVTAPAGFTVTSNFSTSQVIAPNTSASFVIRFDAASPGRYSGQVTFGSNDSNESPFNFNIDALALFPNQEIQILDGATNLVDGIGNVDFGSTPLGTSPTRTFTVVNLGNQNLIVQPVTATAGFTVISNFIANQVIAAGDQASFEVQIDSTDAGSKSGTVTLGNNDADENPFSFTVTGIVRGAEIQVLNGSTPINNGSGNVDFGSAHINQSVTQTLTVRNTGLAELNLGTAIVSNGTRFSIIGQPDAIVPAQSQSEIKIRYDATQTGEHTATISIATNDPDNSTFTFDVKAFTYENVDLIVSNISVPATAKVGDEIDVSWTIENAGTGDFRGSFTDRIWVSSDQQIGGDRLLGDFAFNGSVNAGDPVTRTQRIKLPSDLVGTQYFVVRTDRLSQVVELTETNNTSIDNQSMTIQAPDLRVLEVQAAPVVRTGKKTEVSWKVQNIDIATPGGATWLDRVYLSTDAIYDASDTLLGETPNAQALGAEETYTSSAEVSIPYGTYGLRYLIVRSDATSKIVELREDNNEGHGNSTNVSWQPPDLRVTSVISQFVVFAGTTTRVSYDVRNLGQSPMLESEATWQDRIWLSTDSDLDTGDYSLGTFSHTGVLKPGDGYTQSVDVRVPDSSNLPDGNYYVIVQTDIADQVKEGPFEANNSTSETSLTQLVRTPPPDLVVDSVTPLPATAYSGQIVNVKFNVKNSGAGSTEPGNLQWNDRVYLSTDGTLDSNDRLLSTVVHNGGLAVDAPPYEQLIDVALPLDALGNYQIIVVTNADGDVFGDDLTNNARPTNSIEIRQSPADLDVISVTGSATYAINSPLALSYLVRNIGPQATTVASWKDRVYLSQDTTLDANDVLLTETTRSAALAAGAEYQVSITKPIAQVGTYYVLVQTDATDSVFEIFDANNVANTATQVSIVPSPADLIVSDVTVPATARSGTEMPVEFRVLNTGANATLASAWTDRIYLSTDRNLDASDTLLKTQSRFGTLDANAFYDVSTNVSLPSDVQGSFFILVQTDALNSVFETYDDNNLAASIAAIRIVTQTTDLVVTSFTAPSLGTSGGAIRVDWTVTNQGTGDTIRSAWRERVYLQANNVFNVDTATLIGDFAYTNTSESNSPIPLGATRSVNRSELVTLPQEVTGQRFLFVVVDSTNVISESVETNNSSQAQAITLNRSNVDLQVTAVTAPTTATEGVPFNVAWTVTNFGTTATNASYWYDEVYLSSDARLSSDDVRVGSLRRTNPLDGGDSYSASGTFTAPLGVTQGSSRPFYVLVKTDGGENEQVPETDNANNEKASTNPLTLNSSQTAPLPNLQVTSIEIPASGQVGQPVTVTWTVKNDGPGFIDNESWFDAVYLSLDKILDRQSIDGQNDHYLGFVQKSRTLAVGGTYTATATLKLPANISGDYYVIVATDSGQSIVEGTANELDNTNASANVLTVESKPPADLIVGTITIPTNGISGQTATITYSVTNNGRNPAVGSWYDSVYISSDDKWDANDVLFGRVLHTGDLGPTNSYTESVTAILPGILPGNYRVIIRSDIRNQIAESNEENNIRGTIDAVTLDVPSLAPGVPASNQVSEGESAYFKVIVPANQTLSLSVDSVSLTGETQLFVAKDRLPSRYDFDLSSSQLGESDQTLLVPDTESATYYVLVYRASSPGNSPQLTVRADLIGFSLLSTDTSRIGNSGTVTIGIRGAQLSDVQSITLVGANSTNTREASRFFVSNSSLVYATFDASDLPTGAYSITASNSASEIAILADGIHVEALRHGTAKLSLTMPDRVRVGQTFQATVTVYNDGNVDAPAPLVQIDSNSTMLLGYDSNDLQDKPLTVVVVPTGGFRDVLRPGQSVQIVVTAREYIGLPGTASLEVRSIGESTKDLALTPLLSESEYSQQFGSEANIVKLLMDSYSKGPTNEIVRELVSAAAINLPADVGYADAAYARQNQLSMATYLAAYTDLEELSASIELAQQRSTESFNRLEASNLSPLNSNAHFDELTYAGSPIGGRKYIVAGYLAGNPPKPWVTEMAKELKRICPSDTIVIVSWDSGSGTDLASIVARGFAIGAARGVLYGGQFGALIGGAKGAATALVASYALASAKTRDLGERIAADIRGSHVDASKITIYGHSLGAQAAGFAGSFLNGTIGKIVAFDPAGPGFGILGPQFRLDPEDAKMVETVNTSFLGTRDCDGKANYYPESPHFDFVRSHSFSHDWYYDLLKAVPSGTPGNCGGDPKMGEPSEDCPTPERFGDDLQSPEQKASRKISVVTSHDPNELNGPLGFGPENWVASTQLLDYTIRIENDPVFATAPAQQIRITQTLDSDLDFRTFRLGDFGVGDIVVDVPENRSFYSTRLDLRETKGIYVDMFAGIDVATGEVFWNFIAIDPATGDLPEDPLTGLLPPNLQAPEGEGFVKYSIRAKSDVQTGTRIDGQARIIFDINEPIDTPAIFNTLDAVAPSSSVGPLQSKLISDQGRFLVEWSGMDDVGGSAIQSYDIFVSIDGEQFQPWLSNVTYTSAVYDGPVGQEYAFYSVARDNAGLTEASPLLADASSFVVAAYGVEVLVDGIAVPNGSGSIDFGTVLKDGSTVERTVTIRNTGDEPLILQPAEFLTGSGFALVTNITAGQTLEPNEETTFVVRLNSTLAGSKTATLGFSTNVPSLNPYQFTIVGEVTTVNVAPVGVSSNFTTREDQPYTLKTTDFGFNDPNDSSPDGLKAVKVTLLSSYGTLKYKGVPVTVGQFVSAADIAAGKLVFTPKANLNSNIPLFMVRFQVQDTGGTQFGGVDLDPTNRVLRLAVTPVNDPPIGVSNIVTPLEGTPYILRSTDFGFSDPNDSPSNAFKAVKITLLSAYGTLTNNGVAVTAGQFVTASDIAGGKLVFTPNANLNSNVPLFLCRFQVQDNGGIANTGVDLDPIERVLRFAEIPVNDPPVGSPNTVNTLEDKPYTLKAADFPFQDPLDIPANSLMGVKFTVLSAYGILTNNGVAVTPGQFVSVADINAGKLVFTPTANLSAGVPLFLCLFQVQDDGGVANGGINLDAVPKRMLFNVTAVNDAPVGRPNTVTTLEEKDYGFTLADFGFSDPNDSPKNSLSAVKISTLPLAGKLSNNGNAVPVGASISAADIASGKLKFTPALNGTGQAYSSFTFQVQDNGGTANGGQNTDLFARTMTIAVTNVNDAPAGASLTVSAYEDTPYVLKTSDFGMTDPNDNPANSLKAVKFTLLSAYGVLANNGIPVTVGQFVSASDISSGKLVFTPAPGLNDVVPLFLCLFQVQDNGGTANGGVDLDPVSRRMLIRLASVNDAPVGTSNTVSILKNSTFTFNYIGFGFSDYADRPSNAFSAVIITEIPTKGVLTNNGVAVVAGDRISIEDIKAFKLKYTPDANTYGIGYARFLFKVQDDGGVLNGGRDLDQVARSMTIDVV